MARVNKDIEEIIADAKAEEEVTKTQAKAESEKSFKEELKERLADALKDVKKIENKIVIDIDEYVLLKQKETDLDRVLGAIVDSVGLSYSKSYLTIKNDDLVMSTIRVLYPEAYSKLLAAELEHAEHEGE